MFDYIVHVSQLILWESPITFFNFLLRLSVSITTITLLFTSPWSMPMHVFSMAVGTICEWFELFPFLVKGRTVDSGGEGGGLGVF